MNFDDKQRYDSLIQQSDEARAKAEEALDKGSSVGMREWLEAADQARRLADRIKAGA